MGRADRRILLKRAMGEVVRNGVDLRANANDLSWAVMGATRILIDMLRGHGPSRASNAAKWAHEFFETSLKRNPSEHRIECAKGCAHCCHVWVSAMAPEVFLIANTLREQHGGDFEAVRARIRAAERMTHGLSLFERGRRKLPCALLVDKACSVYSVRPGPCRGMASASVKACERSFAGERVGIPTPSVWTFLKNAHLQAIWAALVAVELPHHSYELNEAIAVALDIPGAEARWLKGEDIFAGIAHSAPESPAAETHNRAIIDRMVAGALGKEITR